MSVFVWDSGRWDQAEWAGAPPPEPGWGADWRWWYQLGTSVWADLNELLVEAVWSTDGHTLGDGTFRGDIQPGTLTARLWDPSHLLDSLPRMGAMWAQYAPTNAVWCWFYDSFTRGLYSPGDPAAADCVFTGTPWPIRLSTPSQFTNYPSQSVSARLAAIAATLSAHGGSSELYLPAVSANVAAQSQTMVANPVASMPAGTVGAYYSPYLQSIRDAAAPGVAWMAPAAAPGGAGSLVLTYARWETAVQRTLDDSQIVAGPATTSAADWLISAVSWSAVRGSDGNTTNQALNWAPQVFGVSGPAGLRMWGDIGNAPGPEHAAVAATSQQLLQDHANPSERWLSSVSLQSGARSTPTGGISSAAWDPYAHVFAPTDVAAIVHDGNTHRYRVVKSDHRLTSTAWTTTHTLEKFTAATPLP